jgi:ubiquinone/menaquinone biosynthesis C-methylase UbiE
MEAQESHHLEKEQKHFKRLFIDVGSGRNPSAYFGTRSLAPDEAYIGIERDAEEIKKGKHWENIRINESNSENILFVQGEAKNLPLQNEATDEVLLSNVLSDPEVARDMETWRDEDISLWFQEFFRVLREGGSFLILNANSPWVAPNIETTKELLAQNGFKIIKVLTLGDKRELNAEWDELVQKPQGQDTK